MRIVWLGGPSGGLSHPLTVPVVGQEYDVPEEVALSLIDQGKVALVSEKPKPEVVHETAVPRRRFGGGEE